MKKQKLYDAITNISEKTVTDAKKYKFKKRTAIWVSAVACLVAVVMVLPMFLGGENVTRPISKPVAPVTNVTELKSGFNAVALASPTPVGGTELLGTTPDNLKNYISKSAKALFSDTDKNVIYSPAAAYFNLAMLSECAYGNSREQILDAFGGIDLEQSRAQAGRMLFTLGYLEQKDMPSSSLWIPDNHRYREDVLKILSETYCTSVYEGDYASDEMMSALKDWMNDKTSGKVSELVDSFKLNEDSDMLLVNTINSQSRWLYEFNEYETKNKSFNSPDGKVSVPFLNDSDRFVRYRRCDNFLVFELQYYYGGKMVFMLPDEDVSVSQMMESEEFSQAMTDSTFCMTNGTFDLSLPKFSITSDVDLADMARSLGITDIFDRSTANLTSLSPDLKDSYICRFSQMVNITVDEGGVEASSINIGESGSYSEGPSETNEIVLDRPFTFVVYGTYGTPLFSGVVNNPAK